MLDATKREFLGTVIRLLARNREMSLGQIRNSTRNFRKRRRISDDSLFSVMREYVDAAMIAQVERKGRVVYACLEIKDMLVKSSKALEMDTPEPTQEEMQRIKGSLPSKVIEDGWMRVWMGLKFSKAEADGKRITVAEREEITLNLELQWRELRKEGLTPQEIIKGKAVPAEPETDGEVVTTAPDPDTVIAESIAAGNEPFK